MPSGDHNGTFTDPGESNRLPPPDRTVRLEAAERVYCDG